MKLNSLKFLLAGVFTMVLCSSKKAFSQAVVFTGLTGNSPIYLTQGATNDVVFGFSVAVPANKIVNPGPFHIAASSSLNGFVSGNLIRTTAATPSLAISAPQASYGAAINSTIDINSFPSLTGGVSGTTYYFYLVLSITTTANPSPASVAFSLPTSATSLSQNTYAGGTTITNLPSSTTYFFGVNPPTIPAVSNCGSGTVTLTASDTSPSGGTYKWYTASSGGTLLQSSTAVTYSAAISSTTTYYVSYTYGTQTSTRTAVTATINSSPLSTFTATSTVVAGGNATITYTGGDPATSSYTWNFNGGTVISGSGQGPYTIQWSAAGTKNVTLSVTNVNGCTSTLTTQSVTVQALVAPTAAAFSNCGAGSITLTPTGGSPAGGTYNWYIASTGGTAFQSSTSSTYTPSLVASRTYYVSYTSGGVESARSVITATVNPDVSSPISGALFSYPFSGNMNDVSGNNNIGYTTISPSLTTDRFAGANTAYNFNGSTQYISQTSSTSAPTTFTISLWFNTLVAGGKLIGFGSSQTGPSTTAYDRNLYMSNTGQLYFGTYSGSAFLTANTSAGYNDGNWHHVIVTVGPSDGTTIYVDGTAQATNSSEIAGFSMTGYWRIGYDQISSTYYTGAPTNPYFTGKLDDIAVYNTELSAAQIAASNNLNQIGAYANVCLGSPITFYAPTITGATYTWQDAGGTVKTGQNPTFSTSVAGNYTLTVTGGPGGCSSTATIAAPVTTASATFTAPSSIFAGSNATITYTGTESAAATYTWNFNGGTIVSGSGQGPYKVNWSTTGAKTITLTVTSATTGCSGSSTQTVTVNSTAATYGNYAFRKNITLNTQAVGITSTLTNFPMLVSIQDDDLIVSGTCADKVFIPNGPNYDLAFVDPSAPGTELYYQIESYDPTTGKLMVWVQIPSVSSAANNQLSFYYGSTNPTVTHNAAFFQKTWTSDYQVVYHFNEAAYSGTTADGTANNRTATLVGFTTTDLTANGKIGNCYKFGGASGSASANDMEAATAPVTTAFTLSAWVKMTSGFIDEKIMTDEGPSGLNSGGYKLGIFSENIPETEDNGSVNRPEAYYYNSVTPTPDAPVLSVGTWYYVQGVYNGSSISTYVNGVQYAVLPSTGNCTLASTLYIGIGEGKQYPFTGLIDEPRVSNVAKTSDWLLMEYNNQNAPTAFCSVGSTRYVNTTNAAALSGGLTYTWTGGTNNIATASNWTCTTTGTAGVLPPFDGTATIVIPAGLANYPTLPIDGALYGLTIGSGASINLGGHILSVGCHIYNGSGGQILYGSSSTAGGITFNGSLATQYYYGSSSGQANIANLTVNNSAAGTVDITGGAVGVNNIVTLTKGNLYIDNAGSGSLTLFSTATNSASVAAIPAAYNITGSVNVQRYITSGTGSRGYRLLTSPVNASTSILGAGNIDLTYLNSNVPFGSTNYYGAYTQGPGTGFTLNGSVNPIIYLYDESRPTNNSSFVAGKNVGIYSITGASGSPAYSITTINGIPATTTSGVNVPVGNSYLFYYVGSDQSSVVSNTRVPDATTLTASGYLNQGNVPVVFWKTSSTTVPYHVTTGTANYGLNQVGNPYPSTISLNTLYTDNYSLSTNPIGAAFYELIPGGNYVTYNAYNGHVSDSRASQYIVSGQGFLMQATGTSPAETLTFKEDQKVAYNTSSILLESFPSGPVLADAHTLNSMPAQGSKVKTDAYKTAPVATTAGADYGLHLQLTKDSANFAQTGIYFNITAADKYLQSEDAVQIDGGTPVVYLSSYSADSVKLSINTLGDYGLGKRVRLYASANVSGTYAMSLADITGIDTVNYSVYLVDNLLSDSLDLVHYKTYSFPLNTADTNSVGSNRFVLAIEHKPMAPYKLSTFSGEKVSTGVQLNWTAVNAGNYTGYTLQKLNAGGSYDSLYAVQSDTSITAYSHIDTHPIIGNNTYRLAQNGISGAITYSVPVTIGYNSSTPNGAITVYPNPAQSTIKVNIASSTINTPVYVADIYNASGALVNHQTVSGSSWSNDVSAYKHGLYVLQVKDTNGNIVGVAKFIKVD